WLLGSYHPTAEGGVVYVRTDITHLKQMEQELRDSERRFRSIAEAHPVPVIISALEQDRTLYASPGLADLLRAPVAAILAIPPEQLFDDPEDRIRIRQGLLHQGRVDSYECILRRVDGSTFTAAITARRLDYLGTDAAVGGIIDLTDRKRAEAEISRQREALHQSEKLTALGSLLAGVAHELNNPLSVVVGRAIMLEETASPEIRARVEKIRQAAERCARIVKIFLAIARQQPPQRMWVQINQLLQSAVALVDYGLHSIGAQLELDLAEHLPPVSLDPDQFTQVFSNLAVNARQALEEVAEPRRLTISTRHHPDRGTISIRFTDNGPGVPRAIRSRIFEPFYTSKAEGMGTGVGLSFSHGVISSHGGTIYLEDPPGGGASFVIYLPVTLGQPDHPPADPVTQALPCPRHILLVDDEPGIIELLEEILTAAGHRVDCTSSGNQALARIAANHYDLILSDLKMPDLDGPGLFERLQQDHPQLAQRMVFITGDILSPDTGQFLARSGRPLIEKPFVPEEILGMVRRELGESRPQDGPGVSNAGNN
ncbi:MAG: ATP-binding protein, partial [Candidatus Competibacteraceae bacterium]|nr:ATP-binding protein [Candidatus Competibacteraceae bacterium]